MKISELILFLSAVLFWGGCATTQEITNADGSVEYKISCAQSMSCEDRAQEVCHGSYRIVRTVQGLGDTKNELYIKCND